MVGACTWAFLTAENPEGVVLGVAKVGIQVEKVTTDNSKSESNEQVKHCMDLGHCLHLLYLEPTHLSTVLHCLHLLYLEAAYSPGRWGCRKRQPPPGLPCEGSSSAGRGRRTCRHPTRLASSATRGWSSMPTLARCSRHRCPNRGAAS
jgi:hypothetical protein